MISVGELGGQEPHISDLRTPFFAKLTFDPHTSGSEPHISGSEPNTTGSKPDKMAPVSCFLFICISLPNK